MPNMMGKFRKKKLHSDRNIEPFSLGGIFVEFQVVTIKKTSQYKINGSESDEKCHYANYTPAIST